MNVYLVKRTDRYGYDDYDSIVCVAADEGQAMSMHPQPHDDESPWGSTYGTPPRTCTLIGTATEGSEPGIVLASFNAG